MSTSIPTFTAISSTWDNGGTSTTINCPSGTQDGDLLVAVLCGEGAIGITVTGIPSGWTLLQQANPAAGGGSNPYLYVYTKIASSEGASWSWSWDSGIGVTRGWGCMRITPANQTTPISASNTASVANSATPSFAASITPTIANSVLVMIIMEADYSSGGISNYAIVTDNPSWTELLEVVSTNSDGALGIAYASRPQITATGNASVTVNAGADTLAVLLAVNIADSTTISDTVISTEVVAAIKGSVASISDAVHTTESVSTGTIKTTWSNPDKSSSIWINQDK